MTDYQVNDYVVAWREIPYDEKGRHREAEQAIGKIVDIQRYVAFIQFVDDPTNNAIVNFSRITGKTKKPGIWSRLFGWKNKSAWD